MPDYAPRRLSRCPAPTLIPMIMDCYPFGGYAFDMGMLENTLPYPTGQATTRHGKLYNVAFVDGHCNKANFSEVSYDYLLTYIAIMPSITPW